MTISKTGAFYVPQLLNNLSKRTGFMSVSGKLELIELMGKLDNEYPDVIIPALHIIQKEPDGQKKAETDEIQIWLEGYAGQFRYSRNNKEDGNESQPGGDSAGQSFSQWSCVGDRKH